MSLSTRNTNRLAIMNTSKCIHIQYTHKYRRRHKECSKPTLQVQRRSLTQLLLGFSSELSQPEWVFSLVRIRIRTLTPTQPKCLDPTQSPVLHIHCQTWHQFIYQTLIVINWKQANPALHPAITDFSKESLVQIPFFFLDAPMARARIEVRLSYGGWDQNHNVDQGWAISLRVCYRHPRKRYRHQTLILSSSRV